MPLLRNRITCLRLRHLWRPRRCAHQWRGERDDVCDRIRIWPEAKDCRRRIMPILSNIRETIADRSRLKTRTSGHHGTRRSKLALQSNFHINNCWMVTPGLANQFWPYESLNLGGFYMTTGATRIDGSTLGGATHPQFDTRISNTEWFNPANSSICRSRWQQSRTQRACQPPRQHHLIPNSMLSGLPNSDSSSSRIYFQENGIASELDPLWKRAL